MNLEERSSEDSKDRYESLQSKMILRAGDLFKDSYPPLLHIVQAKRRSSCTVENKIKTFQNTVHGWSAVRALSVDDLYFAFV